MPEQRELFASMSVEDNLRLGAVRLAGRGDAARALEQAYAISPGCGSGEGRRGHALGRRAADAGDGPGADGRPSVLMLDEPSLGLAPLIVRDLLRVVTGLRERGCAVLLVEQKARAALRMAEYG